MYSSIVAKAGSTFYTVLVNASVANSWQTFSARSTKKFGRWQKTLAPQNILIEVNILVFFKDSQCKIVKKI
jgi:hypothetical protein